MRRERALKVVLVVVGLIFCGLAYPLMMFVKQKAKKAVIETYGTEVTSRNHTSGT
jgi:hypothetical protein